MLKGFTTIRRLAGAWWPAVPAVCLFVAMATIGLTQDAFAAGRRYPKLDDSLESKAISGSTVHKNTVIVTLAPGETLPANLQKYDKRGKLSVINGHVLEGVPDSALSVAAQSGAVSHVHENDAVHATNFRNGVTSGSFFAREVMGYTGKGVRIAAIDSGTAVHDDLPNVSYFQSFVPGDTQQRQDPYGHGTHVAGILAGQGTDSVSDAYPKKFGKLTGVAPGASIVSLKVLDADGNGTVQNVLDAMQFVFDSVTSGNKIQIVNFSIGAPVRKSYWDDPLTLAAKKLVDAGVTVVAAAGNNGDDGQGHKIWGGITSPANAPWVLTVGASSTLGTLTRGDDTMASFSSRGPTIIDRAAKPDIVAAGVGTVSTITPGTLYSVFASNYFTDGSGPSFTNHGYKPYLSLSGTSMSTPVVAGTVALMLEANPSLDPNLIKAILEYTAELHTEYSALEQGAGFLNSLGAVRLARFYATAHPGSTVPVEPIWSQQFNWGNHVVSNGFMLPKANAWQRGVTWGSVKTNGDKGDNIVWGTTCGARDCGDNIVWGTSDKGDNIVWGTSDKGDNIVWGTSDKGDNIVWGTSDKGDNIVWGTTCGGGDCGDNIVWGTSDKGDNIVWGTTDSGDNIVWGTHDGGDNIVWGTSDQGDNIVWGTSDKGDNIVWGTSDKGDNIVWGTSRRQGRGHPVKASSQSSTSAPAESFEWFLNSTNDAAWMLQEFGDTFQIPPRAQR